MSAVKRTAKISLYIFGFLVLIFVAGAIYVYSNMNIIAKQFSEQAASDALGVAVTIGDVDISLENQKVVVSDVKIANPEGYKKPYAVEVAYIVIAAESLSKELLNFTEVSVDGTQVNLEVGNAGTNLSDLKNNIEARQSNRVPDPHKKPIKVIIQKFGLTKAQLNPSVVLLQRDMPPVKVPDIELSDIGEKEGGVVAKDAIAQIMKAVLSQFNSSANRAGFLEGLRLDVLNKMGISTGEVFQKNLKKSFDKDVQQLKDGIQGLKGLFQSE